MHDSLDFRGNNGNPVDKNVVDTKAKKQKKGAGEWLALVTKDGDDCAARSKRD